MLRTHAFGLNLELPFQADGYPERRWIEGQPTLIAQLVTARAVQDAWVASGRVTSSSRTVLSGIPGLSVEVAGSICRLGWPGVGEFVLDGRGRLICARDPGRRAEWERFLTAQVLPLAAVLAGIEVLHASAVVLASQVLGIVGPSGAGKSTIARELTRSGGALLTDDALALSHADGAVSGYPGPNLLRLAPKAADSDERSGALMDASGKLGLLVDDAPPARYRVRSLYFLDRLENASTPRIEASVGLEDLLGATFSVLIQTPERLTRHLDLVTALVANVDIHRVSVPRKMPASDTADLIFEHVGASISRGA